MKPRNFPARKHARRAYALHALPLPQKEGEDDRNYGHRLDRHAETLKNTTLNTLINDPRAVRTKINRSLKSFGR